MTFFSKSLFLKYVFVKNFIPYMKYYKYKILFKVIKYIMIKMTLRQYILKYKNLNEIDTIILIKKTT